MLFYSLKPSRNRHLALSIICLRWSKYELANKLKYHRDLQSAETHLQPTKNRDPLDQGTHLSQTRGEGADLPWRPNGL